MFISETESTGGGKGRETENHRITDRDAEAEAGSRLPASTQSPTRGLNSRTERSCPEPKSDAPLTEPPRCPDAT